MGLCVHWSTVDPYGEMNKILVNTAIWMSSEYTVRERPQCQKDKSNVNEGQRIYKGGGGRKERVRVTTITMHYIRTKFVIN